MSLYKKYELGEVIRDDGVKSFQARAIDSGRQVQVHLIMGVPGRMPPPYELLDQLKALAPENRSHLLETGEHGGTPYIVTAPLDGFSGFRDWLAEKTGRPRGSAREGNSLSRVGRWKIPSMTDPPPAAAPLEERTLSLVKPPKAAAVNPDFEETRLFSASPAAPSSPPVEAASEFTKMFQAVTPAAPAEPAAAEPGEFTRQFSAADFAQPAAAPAPRDPGEFTRQFQAASPPVAPQAPLAGSDPGEFTRQFHAGSPLPSLPSSPAVPAAKNAGEFTAIFGSPSLAGPNAPPPAAADTDTESTLRMLPVARNEPPSPPSSGLTKLFETPASRTAQPAVGGDYEKLFGKGDSPQPPVPGSPGTVPFGATSSFPVQPPPAVPGMGTPPPQSGPSEYTRMFEAPAEPVAPLPAAPAATPLAPATTARKPVWPLALLGVLVLLLIIGLIVTLVRK